MDDIKAPRKTKPARKQSSESRWIGFLVLGFGILAVVAVGLLALQNSKGVEDTINQQAAQSAEEQNDLAEALDGIRDGVRTQQENAIEDADLDTIKGVWETQLVSGKAVIELKKSKYRMIVAGDGESSRRYYSNGTYEIMEDGVLVLTPNLTSRPPQDSYRYSHVHRGPIPVKIGQQEGYMIWTPPGIQSKVFVPSIHPFLRLASEQIAVWKKL